MQLIIAVEFVGDLVFGLIEYHAHTHTHNANAHSHTPKHNTRYDCGATVLVSDWVSFKLYRITS